MRPQGQAASPVPCPSLELQTAPAVLSREDMTTRSECKKGCPRQWDRECWEGVKIGGGCQGEVRVTSSGELTVTTD